MLKRLATAALLGVLFACDNVPHEDAPAQPLPAAVQPVAPPPVTAPAFIAEGACPFECCHYGRWRVAESAVLRASASVDAESVGFVARRATVPVDSGVVIIGTAGLVAITGPVTTFGPEELPFVVGDTLEVLDYQGEGISRVRWRDSLMFVDGFWDSAGTRGGTLLRPADQSWWARVAIGARHGWMLVTATPDSGADACS